MENPHSGQSDIPSKDESLQGTASPVAVTPAQMTQPTAQVRILAGAVGTNLENATLNVFDPDAEAGSSTEVQTNLPAVPENNGRVDILCGAKDVNGAFLVVNVIHGNHSLQVGPTQRVAEEPHNLR